MGVPPGDDWWKQNRLITSDSWPSSGEVSFPSVVSTSAPLCDGLDGLVSSIDVEGEEDGDKRPLSFVCDSDEGGRSGLCFIGGDDEGEL